ncbi:MAG: c-type cytochrome [Gemmatimonadaceae bacterium]
MSGLLSLAVIAGCGGGDREPPAGEAAAEPGGTVAAAPTAQESAEELYQRCVTCHQASGEGLAGTFPPLAGSEYATATNAAVPIRIVLHGMQGPMTVKGTQYNGVMPAYGTGIEMTDAEIAAVLTYVRQSWGNRASAVTPQQVAAERDAARPASGPVTAEELQSLMAGG